MTKTMIPNYDSRDDTRTQRRHSWGSEFDYHCPELPIDDNQDQLRYEDFSSSDDNEITNKNSLPLEFDLIAVCHNVAKQKSPHIEIEKDCIEIEEQHNSNSTSNTLKMGQTSSLNSSSSTSSKPKLSLTWVLRNNTIPKNIVLSPEPPIKFQYSKIRRKNSSQNDAPKQEEKKNTKVKPTGTISPTNEGGNFIRRNSSKISKKQIKEKLAAVNAYYDETTALNTKGLPTPTTFDHGFLLKKRTSSEPTLVHSSDKRHRVRVRHKRRSRSRIEQTKISSRFGYDIEDIDSFLTKASLKKPANIPVVLSYRSMLYQTQYDDYQDEIPLPLGMVVNAVFKKESWLYVQTPHGEEGYISYSACLPLGIIPQDEDSSSPCWETSTDLFPRPCGNMTDSEKLTQSECSNSKCKRKVRKTTTTSASVCGERSVDRLYLRATHNSQERDVKRQTLLVIDTDYEGTRKNTICVSAGDVVALISANIKGWFWVRTRDGNEGFIPASIAGHGYL
ncbi:uncharacterized protein LOC123296096 [Chrysoperla carnea]|uniref:uncharacterized protein LOC123296096 n=1 Tax=Chrysoperla carnea TaxID=189513 RepID=UPI001D076BB7|nr:uncharacterized protein LOC123296096 [Chrysoperla carnea]